MQVALVVLEPDFRLLERAGTRATLNETDEMDETQQRPGATPTHNFCLRTDHACENIDGGDQCFCIVARAATRETLPLRALAGQKEQPITIMAAGLSPTGDDAGALPYGSGAGRNSTSCSAETRTTSSVSVISWSWSNSSLRRPAGETQKRQRVGSWVVLK